MTYSHHISSVMSDQELVQNTDLHKQTEMKDVLELAPRELQHLHHIIKRFQWKSTYGFAHGWNEKFLADVQNRPLITKKWQLVRDVVKGRKIQPHYQDQAKFHLSTRTVLIIFHLILDNLVFPVWDVNMLVSLW